MRGVVVALLGGALALGGLAVATGTAVVDTVTHRFYQGILEPGEVDDPGPGIYLTHSNYISQHWLTLIVEGSGADDEVALWAVDWDGRVTSTLAEGTPPTAKAPSLGGGGDAWFRVEGRSLAHPVGYTVSACHAWMSCGVV